MKKGWEVHSLEALESRGDLELGRGKVISKKDLAASPGTFPVYSSAKENDGKFGEYGEWMFDEELITWSVDGGGRLFHRPKHKFSVTNVGGFIRVSRPNRIYCRYLYFVLVWLHSQVEFDWVKKAHPSVIRKIYSEIPLPPLPEQKRIVEVLDKAFEGLATAKANAEANLQNARELFGRLRDDLLCNESHDWSEFRLEDLLERITYGFTNPMPDADDGPYKVTAKNVANGVIDYQTARKTTWQAFENLLTDKSRPKVGDVLLTKDGTLGRTAVVDRADICVNQSVAVLTPTKAVNSVFLANVLSCRKYQDDMIADAGGTTIKHLYITRVPKLRLRIPGPLIQVELNRSLDHLNSETARLALRLSEKVNELEMLKQSLLQKAFAGELT